MQLASPLQLEPRSFRPVRLQPDAIRAPGLVLQSGSHVLVVDPRAGYPHAILFSCSPRGATRVPRSQWRQQAPLLHLTYARGNSIAENKETEQGGKAATSSAIDLSASFHVIMDF